MSHSEEVPSEIDYAGMSTSELFEAMLDRNSDPLVDEMLRALIDKLPVETTEEIEEEKRNRSVVISGLKECSPNTLP